MLKMVKDFVYWATRPRPDRTKAILERYLRDEAPLTYGALLNLMREQKGAERLRRKVLEFGE